MAIRENTMFDDVIQEFYHYIEHDVDFFQYFELSAEECLSIAAQRSIVLLKEGVAYLKRKVGSTSVFNYDAENEEFLIDLNYDEINLIVKSMFLCYLHRDITTLRTFQGVMTSSDLNMYSPANERKTFNEMVTSFEEKLKIEISEYVMIDRDTGEYKQICT